MLFNSIDFALFLPFVFLLYWLLNELNLRVQNCFIALASYLFYGWWDWRFLMLIFFSTVVDFLVGKFLERTDAKSDRNWLLAISVSVNLGLLGFFKYYHFFVENFAKAFTFFGHEIETNTLQIILPVGISFYTFQTMSYTIDVYRRNLTATKDFVSFAAFVSFFPQLVAGPIERASNLLPQFYRKRSFDYSKAVDGMRQILWGLFKKVVIADSCAVIADNVFNNPMDYNGSTLLLGAVFFAFQIYGDFSGYSDIAIGTARLFGFNLMQNFATPYFSRDIAEFWRRWHISLSTWFRDYLYIPLGGSKGGVWIKVRNTFVIFIVSGFWHGANWTFLIWGFLNALYFLPLLLGGSNRKHTGPIAAGRWLPSMRESLSIASTFFLTSLAWVFFRAENTSSALSILSKVFSPSLLSLPNGRGFIGLGLNPVVFFFLLFVFIVLEWFGRNEQFAIERLASKSHWLLRRGLYLALFLLVLYFSDREQEFIYFQF